ncbi:MAG: hypothetical protein QGI45_09995 [Myxococcota bacterium]|jgi:hypothetical protein|nr:hypothetical protein [Myxococcota bacterium]
MKFLCRHKNSLKGLFAFALCLAFIACGFVNWPGQTKTTHEKRLDAYDAYTLLGAFKTTDGKNKKAWQRFQINAYVDEEGEVRFQQRIALERAQYMAVDYVYRLKGNAAHTLQGNVMFFNEKSIEMNLELMLRLEFKEKRLQGYAKSVANLSVEAWDGVAMVHSIGEEPLLEIEFGEKGAVNFFAAPFSYMRYGVDQSGSTDSAAGREKTNLVRRASGVRLHYRFAQSSQSKLKIKSWHWLEPKA